MPGKAVGRAAVDLPWLCPNTNGLVGLAENPAGLARLASADPALFVFLIRYATGESGSPFIPPSDRLVSPSLPETAAAFLGATRDGWLDHSAKVVATINKVGDLAGAFAHRLAQRTHRVAPEAAETAARLAPLGWYAVVAVDASEASACLHDPSFGADPTACQHSWWGWDHDAIARRLAARWRLPRWVAGLIGSFNLPREAAVRLGADPDLFAVVSLAVRAAEERVADLGLVRTHDRDFLLAHLKLDADVVGEVLNGPACRAHDAPPPTDLDPNPHHVPLVRNLLRSAAEARRRNGASLVVRLEGRIDELHRAAADLAGRAGDRLRDAKLAGLAELAAGAGHEINNPLAVISANAQRLLRTEADRERVEALQGVIRQTQRITGILRDLMQFARPRKPEKGSLSVAQVMTAVHADLQPLAQAAGVRLELVPPPADVWLAADAKQIQHALAAVTRNGVECAGTGGWVRLRCEARSESLGLVVEDGGPGLTLDASEHAFDPFYCGRSAGRGRGLGLPTAWRLVRQNGGDVRFEPIPGGPTRFVLLLPNSSDDLGPATRKSA